MFIRPKEDWVGMALLIGIISIILSCFNGCREAYAEPDYQALADSIRIAEGNSNYGVLTHYKHTSYRQACINTCAHAYRDWIKMPWRGSNAKSSYLEFLSKRYAPIGAKNDPNNLNKNWLKNVSKLYNGDI